MAPPKGYDSNLASEFYVLSCLHRLGQDATISFGNKKSVDIQVVQPSGIVMTLDVKASAAKADWPLGKDHVEHPDRHFIVFVGYEGNIQDLSKPPRLWIVPYAQIRTFVRTYKGDMRVASRAEIGKSGDKFENAWHLITGAP